MFWKSSLVISLLLGTFLGKCAADGKPQPFYLVDAFTVNDNTPFSGSGSAVVIMDYDDEITDEVKHKIALEAAQEFTAFVSFGWKKGENVSDENSQVHARALRWFDKKGEMPFCGAATFSATKAVEEAQLGAAVKDPNVKTIEIGFHTKSAGKVGATIDKAAGSYALKFANNPSAPLDVSKNPWIEEMIAATLGKDVPRAAVTDIRYVAKAKTVMLTLGHEKGDKSMSLPELLKKVNPDFAKMLSINTGETVVYFFITVKGEAQASDDPSKGIPHFYSRWFAPWKGVNEDPACALAHIIMTPYWSEKLGAAGGKTMLGKVLSKRGGRFLVTQIGDKVQLAGDARITIKGEVLP